MRHLMRAVAGLAVAGLAVGPTSVAVGAPRVPTPDGLEHASVVAELPTGDGGAFAESMAPDGHGALIVSVTTWGVQDDSEDGWAPNSGQLWKVRPDGTTSRFGPQIDLSEYGQLMGVAVDELGRVFVAVENFGSDYYDVAEDPPSGVLRVTSGQVSRVMTLPADVFVNGLAVKDQSLFVTDSAGGSIWKGPTRTGPQPRPWFGPSEDLAPLGMLGANGIAYRDGAVYVASYDRGKILRIPVRRNGSPGSASVLAEDPALVTADGITFDWAGRLWVATNGQYDEEYDLVVPPALVVVDREHGVTTVETPDGALDYPTALAFGSRGRVYVANGSFVNGAPGVVALKP